MKNEPEREQVALMPVERSYDVRAKQIIAFNECRKAGGDLDDALDAAYKAALRYTPAPAEQIEAVARVRESPVRKRLSVELLRSHMKDGDLLYAEQPAPAAVVPDLTELREYHANAANDLEHYADDSGLRESDVKHYRKRAEFHRRQLELIDSLNTK